MRRFQILLLFIAISCSMFAQDRLSLFIGRANKYASVELSDYRKRLCVEYNVSNRSLDDYYRRCGSDWGNVGLALEIARTSGKHMRDVCDYYKRYHRYGWNRILVEIGIKPGSTYYNPFYDRIHYHSNCWHEHYCSYCDHHNKHHHKHYKSINAINTPNGMIVTMTIGMMTMMTTNTFHHISVTLHLLKRIRQIRLLYSALQVGVGRHTKLCLTALQHLTMLEKVCRIDPAVDQHLVDITVCFTIFGSREHPVVAVFKVKGCLAEKRCTENIFIRSGTYR